jgi:inhibitor of cysteine peptidase
MSHLVTEADNGKVLELKLHEALDVRLPESRMAGYRWQMVQSGEPLLKSAEIKTQATGSLPGQANIRSWQFTAEQPGSAQVQMQHRRSWERDKPGREFSLTVKVVA